MKGAKLHCNLLAGAQNVVAHTAFAAGNKVFFFLFDQKINAVKGKVEADKTAIYNNWFNQVYQTTGSASEYQITFDSNGGSAVASETVASGGTVTQPTDPTLADHTFAGWFLDPTFTQAYDFTAPVYTNLVLYAKWEEV